MKSEIMGRFAKLEGYNHERDGIKIPQPAEVDLFHKVELMPYDVKRIKEIAEFEGKDSNSLTDVDVWGIVSAALIENVVSLRIANGKIKRKS
jgi:hypothetical protein